MQTWKFIPTWIGVTFAAALFTPQAALADLALARASACMACHKEDVKLVGPSFKDIAEEYRGDADAKEKLIGVVRSGSVGTWGKVPMPANTMVSDDDIATLVDWILSH